MADPPPPPDGGLSISFTCAVYLCAFVTTCLLLFIWHLDIQMPCEVETEEKEEKEEEEGKEENGPTQTDEKDLVGADTTSPADVETIPLVRVPIRDVMTQPISIKGEEFESVTTVQKDVEQDVLTIPSQPPPTRIPHRVKILQKVSNSSNSAKTVIVQQSPPASINSGPVTRLRSAKMNKEMNKATTPPTPTGRRNAGTWTCNEPLVVTTGNGTVIAPVFHGVTIGGPNSSFPTNTHRVFKDGSGKIVGSMTVTTDGTSTSLTFN
ncbi:protein ORF53 [Anguillid herpesvirus 1]|nr:protein ORF53 [Anguillid herpesvirus 1]